MKGERGPNSDDEDGDSTDNSSDDLDIEDSETSESDSESDSSSEEESEEEGGSSSSGESEVDEPEREESAGDKDEPQTEDSMNSTSEDGVHPDICKLEMRHSYQMPLKGLRVNDSRNRRRSNSWERRDEVLSPRMFRRIRLLGHGDVGSVFLAVKRGTDELFALKVLSKAEMLQRNKVKRVMTEKEILATSHHPFIVSFFHSFQTERSLYFVMEYCAGGEFFRLLQRQRNGRLDEDTARFYAAEVLLALEYLHFLGFIYRDLKPENILMHHSGHVMLADFDLSKRTAAPTAEIINGQLVGESKEMTTSFVGTEEYIAPEVIKGYGYNSSVDWWSFGILLYEILFGQTPFRGRTTKKTFSHILFSHEIKFPDRPHVSHAAKSLIRSLLKRDAKKRLGATFGAPELKQHPFFKSVKWPLLRNQKPPLVPHLDHPLDTRYFPQFSEKEERNAIHSTSVDQEKDVWNPFEDFDSNAAVSITKEGNKRKTLCESFGYSVEECERLFPKNKRSSSNGASLHINLEGSKMKTKARSHMSSPNGSGANSPVKFKK